MTPTEILLVIALVLVVIAEIAYSFIIGARAEELRKETAQQYERREKALLACLKEAQNRIHARDLSGYMALQAEDRKAVEDNASFALDDQAEAAIAAQRQGLRMRNASAFVNPGTNGVGE